MATEIITIVDTEGGGDYLSINTALTAKQRDLVAADEIQIFECKGGADYCGYWYFQNYVTDADHPIIIRNHSSEPPNGYFDTNRYYIYLNNTSDKIIIYQEDIIFQGIQFKMLQTDTAGLIFSGPTGSHKVQWAIDKCIFMGTGTNSIFTFGYIRASGGLISITNNMMQHGELLNSAIKITDYGNATDLYIINNTLDCNWNGFQIVNNGGLNNQYIRNNLVTCGNPFYPFESGTASHWVNNDDYNDYNFVADNDVHNVLGSHGESSIVPTYTDVNNSDLRTTELVVNGQTTSLLGVGDNVSNILAIPTLIKDYLSISITGETRGSVWDIGANQVSASPDLAELYYGATETFTTLADVVDITLLNDMTGQELITDNIYQINWIAPDSWSTIDIYYGVISGDNSILVEADVPNNGIYLWTVPEINSATATIRIKNSDGVEEDTSVEFSIFNIILAPTNLNYTFPYAGLIRATWNDNSDNEDGFLVSYSSSLSIGFFEFTPTTNNYFEFSPGVGTWYIKVRAYKGTTYSNYTDPVQVVINAPIAAPTELVGQIIEDDVLLNWTNGQAYDTINIERAIGSGSFSTLVSLLGSTTSYTDTGLADNIYYYQVKGINTLSSPYSNRITINMANDPTASWLDSGLSIDTKNAVIKTSTPPSTLISECKASNLITIEAWIKPDNSELNGPGMIITNSLNENNRNFSLCQNAGVYQVRLRGNTTDLNGKPNDGSGIFMQSAAGAVTPSILTHFVFTYDGSTSKFYINGTLNITYDNTVPDYQIGNFSTWNDSYKIRLGNEMTVDLDNKYYWLGDIYLFAVYDKVLSLTEVGQNYGIGDV